MSHSRPIFLSSVVLCLSTSTAAAQSEQKVPTSNIVSKSVTAIGFPVGGGTKVDLKGTDLILQANGEAKVEAKQGRQTLK